MSKQRQSKMQSNHISFNLSWNSSLQHDLRSFLNRDLWKNTKLLTVLHYLLLINPRQPAYLHYSYCYKHFKVIWSGTVARSTLHCTHALIIYFYHALSPLLLQICSYQPWESWCESRLIQKKEKLPVQSSTIIQPWSVNYRSVGVCLLIYITYIFWDYDTINNLNT